MSTEQPIFTPLVCVVNFHHARGPEVERWVRQEPKLSTAVEDEISIKALPDGAHSLDEEFSYFTLALKEEGNPARVRSVFGISCTQQLDSAELLYRPEEVTRSAVQKAVVVVTDRPQDFSALREKLSVVTRAWFAQKDFRDVEILEHFQESLSRDQIPADDEQDQFFGLSLREILHIYKWQTLVLLKCLLLESRILFFGSHCEQLCQVQFSLLSLIPGLVRNLQDCASPELDSSAALKRRDSVRTSDRASLLAYMGLPLQIFTKGAVFGPYTPLQQMDSLAQEEVRSYVIGTTNSLLLSQKERYCDVLVNLDEHAVQVLKPSLKPALTLSTPDRRWIDFLTQSVVETWQEADPSQPSTHGYAGSEEFIRLQFESYILAMLSAVKYHDYLESNGKAAMNDIQGDPIDDFSPGFVAAWRQSSNFRVWNRITDDQVFDIVEPSHPCAGGLTIDDVQRRLAAQVAELHLDERFQQTREVVGRRLADGRTQVTTAFNKVWSDIETMREAQRKRGEENRVANPDEKPALQSAQATVQAAGQRAGAFLSSWGTWANDKRKQGWNRGTANDKPV